MDEQHRLQEEIARLEKVKRRQRQDIFKAEDEIIEKRDALIATLEKRLAQRTENEILFTIRWEVVCWPTRYRLSPQRLTLQDETRPCPPTSRNSATSSLGAAQTDNAANLQVCSFGEEHLAFLDADAIWFELQQFKNERAWFNLNLPREAIPALLRNPSWYRLFIPKAEMEFTRFDRVRRWEEIAVALLKKYVDRYYKFRKQEWEADFLEFHELSEDDPNFVHEYRLLIEESAETIVENLGQLKAMIQEGTFKGWEWGNLQALWFGRHLYQPLLHFKSDLVQVSTAALNDGERDFIVDLRDFCDENKAFLEDRELYLLRNISRRGIGFFEAGNFYPDFIVWLLIGDKQYITFVDPKGIRNLEGPNDPKIQFYKTIKSIECHPNLDDPDVVLNSFIISNTLYRDVGWWDGGMSKTELEKCHVLFQKEDKTGYVNAMLKAIVDS